MATLALTPLPATGAVRLSIDQALSGVRTITRRDANGLYPVRTYPGTLNQAPALRVARRNLCVNPRAVSTGAAAAWKGETSAGGAFTLAWGTDGGPLDGVTTYRRMTVTTAPASWIRHSVQDTAQAVTEGKHYTLSSYLRLNRDSGYGWVGLQWVNASGAVLSEASRGNAAVVANQWARIVARDVVAPAGAVRAHLYVGLNGFGALGDVIDATAVLLEEGTEALGYADGATPSDDTASYSWEGPANGSTSIQEVQDVPLVLDDYEAASGHVAYDVETVAGAMVTTEADWSLEGPWLFTPVMPGYARRVERIESITATRQDNSTVHQNLLGRPDPVVVMRPHAPRAGTMTLWAGTYADAMVLLEPLDQGLIFMLRQPEHARLDMYFHASAASITHGEPDGAATTWGVSLDYVEVRRPIGDLAGALGWTFASVASSAASMAELTRQYATFQDLYLNVRKA